MSDDLQAAKNYLTPAPSTFWRWKDGGEVVAWAGGTTIVFHPELAQVLARLAPNGLPPLGAVLLVLAATRASWWEEGCGPVVLAGLTEKLDGQRWKNELVADVSRGLERVARLPDEVRATTVARAELAGLVFEQCSPRTSSGVGAEAVRLLEQGLPEEVLTPGEAPRPWDEAPTVFWYELRSLRHGLDSLDAEALSMRCKTGLDEVVGPAEIELTPAERARSLIAQLENDDELSGVGRLARHLMAAVSLPRAVSDREDLPLGGVSDISNRGPLDRVLLSELAHDDLTLAVRVATGEALYLRREQPPRTPPRERVLVLESGIRSWGVPRVFSAAVALALTATTDAHTSVTTYRASGAGVVPVDLTTRQGLIDHLAALETEPHPGAALRPLLAILEERETPHDLVLVTAEDVLADRAFQRDLATCEPWPLHVATVRRDGRFELLLCGGHGRKTLRTATLDLDVLVAKKTKQTRLIDEKRARALPAILAVRPFPLRVPPHGAEPSQMWFVPGVGVFCVARDRRLVLWTARTHGPRQLDDDLPRGGLLWASSEYRGGIVRAVIGDAKHGELYLLTINVAEGRCVSSLVDRLRETLQGICSEGGRLFLIYPGHFEVIDPESGWRRRSVELLPGMSCCGDRFFRVPESRTWYALGFDGLSAQHIPVVTDRELNGRTLLALFEKPGVDGAIGITAAGDLYFTATRETKVITHGLAAPVVVMAISRNGERVVLRGKTASGLPYQCGIEVSCGVAHPWSGDPFSYTERFTEYGSTASLRNYFTHAGVVPGGTLALLSRKHEVLGLGCDQGGAMRLMKVSPQEGQLYKRIAFQPTAGPPGVGYTLKVATWPDGSRVLLDSRGLLHLMSANLSIPEMAIVLTNGALAGWCADGRVWGSSFFHEPGLPVADRQTVLDTLNAFARQLP
jgi:hypothetical protein